MTAALIITTIFALITVAILIFKKDKEKLPDYAPEFMDDAAFVEVENRCEEGIHLYQHVYDEEVIRPTQSEINKATEKMNMVLFRMYVEQMTSRKKTYVQSVCKYCGHVVKRDDINEN